MLFKIKILLAAAVLSGTVSANVQAATFSTENGTILTELTHAQSNEKWNDPADLLIGKVKQYTVNQGETLTDIAFKFNVSASQIKDWNQLITDQVYPGLNLSIYEGLSIKSSVVLGKEKTGGQAAAVLSPTLAAAVTSTVASAPIPPAVKPKVRQSAAIVSRPAAATAAANGSVATVKAKATKTEPVSASTVKTKTKPEPAAPATKTEPAAKAESTNATSPTEITVKATAYTASCEGCSGVTATGINIKANPDEKVIAVDPKVIPLGSKVYVEGFGEATAADTGGAIKGNRIDVFIPSEQEAKEFGVQQLKVKILD